MVLDQMDSDPLQKVIRRLIQVLPGGWDNDVERLDEELLLSHILTVMMKYQWDLILILVLEII
jgi:hypothetical protein